MIARPGARSSRFARFAASAISTASARSRRPETYDTLAASTSATAAPPKILIDAGGDAPLEQRAQVPAEAAVTVGAAEQVVDEAEQPEAEAREQHERPGDVAARFVAETERAERPAPGLDHQRRDHHEQARPRSAATRLRKFRRCSTGASSTSRPPITSSRTVSSPTTRPRPTITPLRARRPRTVSSTGAGELRAGAARSPRTVTTISTGVTTPSMTPAIAMPESFSNGAEHDQHAEADQRRRRAAGGAGAGRACGRARGR